MVNDSGQLYTLEGLAAGALMIITAYLVLNTTTILTPGDVHVVDMQLEQLGNDGLKILDTPSTSTSTGDLESYLSAPDSNQQAFRDSFLSYCNWLTGNPVTQDSNPGSYDDLKFNAFINYIDNTGNLQTIPFFDPTNPKTPTYLNEHAVKISRWVYLENPDLTAYTIDPGPKIVLLEVLLWRD